MHKLPLFCVAAALSCLTACGDPTPSASTPDHPGAKALATLELFINNHRYGATNACYTTLDAEGTLTCGHPGAVSALAWKLDAISKDGTPTYTFTRRFPADTDHATQTTQTVALDHLPVTLFEDDAQQILLRHATP